jgi:hypothetical protein
MGPREYSCLQRLARSQGMTVTEWVRQTLRVACRLSAIRTAAEFRFPTDDLDGMLGEIEAGYPGSLPP